jgi:hypothetical protein
MACELPKSGYVDFRRDGLLLLNEALARQGKQYQFQLWIFLGAFLAPNSSDALNPAVLISAADANK